jgi:hypothetical protein
MPAPSSKLAPKAFHINHLTGFILSVLGAVLLLTSPAQAAEHDPKIQRAINQGIAFLRSLQGQDGIWPHASSPERKSSTNVGATALAAWALLESGVKPTDPAVQRAAEFLRQQVPTLGHTYSLSGCIWFFDRMGDKADEPLIELMTVKLLAGQNAAGGWTYECPKIAPEEARRLINVIKLPAAGKKDAPPGKGGGDAKGKDAPMPPPAQGLEELLKKLAGQGAPAPGERVVPPPPANVMNPQGPRASGDNSNTQFATLALWVARRHSLMVDDALDRVDQRFRQMQLANGSWPYSDYAIANSTPSMTCAGLIGLAVTHGAAVDAAKAKGKPAKVKDPNKDPNISAGFMYLGAWLQEFDQGRTPELTPDRFFYFLWSLERVGEVYCLKTIGKVDWYAWGSNLLLNSQQPDGGWGTGIGVNSRAVDTSFALLFLSRANVAKDLSVVLKGRVSDPGTRTLKARGAPADNVKEKAEKVADASDKNTAKTQSPELFDPKEKLSTKKTDPANEDFRSAQRMTDELVATPDEQQAELLSKYKEGKGPAYTQALAGAIPRLKGENKSKARDALAERFTRMTAATLREELKDDDPEIRRAGALACAMKDDKGHIPDLIPLLEDKEPLVGRAAHAALKSLSSQDFGPAKDASPNQQKEAIAAWKGWWARQEVNQKQ